MFFKKRNKKIILFMTLVLVLAMTTYGCGSNDEETDLNGEDEVPEEEDIEEEEPVEEEEEAVEEEAVEEEEVADGKVISIDNWKNPTNLIEFVDTFEELEWRWSNVRDNEEQDSTTLNYKYEGNETIDGVDTSLLAFSVDNEEFKIWVDESGNAVQVEAEDMTVSGELANQILDSFESAIFWPFEVIEKRGVRGFLEKPVSGVDWRVISTEMQQFGEFEAEVTSIEVDFESPMTEEGLEGTLLWKIGDFDGEFQMLVEYKWLDMTTETDSTITHELIKVVPR